MKRVNIIAGIASLILFSVVIIIQTHSLAFDWKFYAGWIGFLATFILIFSYDRKIKSSIEILNDYIIIEHIEVKAASTFHMTTQDQSKLVYKDALVKFTPKESRVKPGDTVIYNKAMAYPYLLDGKQHFIITEEYIVAIK